MVLAIPCEDNCDKQVYPLTNISLALNNASAIEIPLYLYQAQMRVNELFQLTFGIIDGKSGWVRSAVLGGCYNYTARSVIVLDPSLQLDQIDVPYKSFIVLYSGQLIKEIRRDKGWTITKAHNFLRSKFMFDPYIYSLIERIIERDKPVIVCNRNPTITFGSILAMRIRRVKTDSDDVTMSIPSAILPSLNESAFSINPSNCGKPYHALSYQANLGIELVAELTTQGW